MSDYQAFYYLFTVITYTVTIPPKRKRNKYLHYMYVKCSFAIDFGYDMVFYAVSN